MSQIYEWYSATDGIGLFNYKSIAYTSADSCVMFFFVFPILKVTLPSYIYVFVFLSILNFAVFILFFIV